VFTLSECFDDKCEVEEAEKQDIELFEAEEVFVYGILIETRVFGELIPLIVCSTVLVCEEMPEPPS
jgi:hypothetical protein